VKTCFAGESSAAFLSNAPILSLRDTMALRLRKAPIVTGWYEVQWCGDGVGVEFGGV